MSISGLLHHTLAGRVLEGLTNPQKNGNSAESPAGTQSPVNGPDTLTPPSQRPDGSEHHDNGWQQHGPGGTRHAGPETGSPSPQEPSGMQTGGPAPQGLQDVLPNIAQQLVYGLASVLGGVGSLEKSELTTPQIPAQSNAQAQAGAIHGEGRGQVVAGNVPLGLAEQQTVARAVPANTTAASNSQAATIAGANPAAPALTQPATSALPRSIGDAGALTLNRPAETSLPPPSENSLLNRIAATMQPGAMPPTTTAPPTLPALPPGLTQGMTAAAGLTMASAVVNQPVDARGAILAANDHAGMRVDNAITLAGHTLDGLQRRPMRNRVMQLLPPRITRLLWAMGFLGTQASEPDPERELQRVMQWLFWMLAVIAYGCLAVAIVVLVGSNARMFDYEASRAYTGGLAFFGLLIGTVAWLLARRMSRR